MQLSFLVTNILKSAADQISTGTVYSTERWPRILPARVDKEDDPGNDGTWVKDTCPLLCADEKFACWFGGENIWIFGCSSWMKDLLVLSAPQLCRLFLSNI